jgi:hypothetical protein
MAVAKRVDDERLLANPALGQGLPFLLPEVVDRL